MPVVCSDCKCIYSLPFWSDASPLIIIFPLVEMCTIMKLNEDLSEIEANTETIIVIIYYFSTEI